MKLVSRELLVGFLEVNQIDGVVDLLSSEENLKDFFIYLTNEGFGLEFPESEVLFHGSQVLMDDIAPNHSIGSGGVKEEEEFLYATDDLNYAIFMACLSLDQGEASVNIESKETMLFIDLDFVNGPSQLKSGYLHLIDKSNFERIPNNEYRSKEEVEVLLSIPVEPGDITVPIYVVDKFE